MSSRYQEKLIHIIDGKAKILVCESCDRVADITEDKCSVCGGELIYFIKEDQDEKARQDIKGVLRVQDSDNQWDRTEQFQGDSEEA